jgi:hypothetical protein
MGQRVSAASEPRERSGAGGPRERACKGVRGTKSPGESLIDGATGIGPVCIIVGLLVTAASTAPVVRSQDPAAADRQRLEGEVILAMADAAMEGRAVPADFNVRWQNEFLKAQRGTFVPFTLAIHAAAFTQPSALIYVRAFRKDAPAPTRRDRDRAFPTRPSRDSREPPLGAEYPLEVMFPADLKLEPGQIARISRGFTLGAGSYEVVVVVRERAAADRPAPKACVVRQPLVVPDFSTPAFTTSSVIVADRIDSLPQPLEPDQLVERPYVIGQHDITPAADRVFRKTDELVVLFLIYHPMVTTERKFDLQVEYHFFRKGGAAGPARGGGDHPPALPGERYFNHTDPQRFTPVVLGEQFDPSVGQPVMAGQGVPLSGFQEGEYRLAIRITDRLAGTSISRDVFFTVGS